MQTVAYVIPCFNEAGRLSEEALLQLMEPAWVSCVLVDDGSTDGTRALLERLARRWPTRAAVLALGRNQGKAEAVRQGLQVALLRAAVAGYADADFATPPDELHRLAQALAAENAEVAIGARVGLSGWQIDRSPARHYLGRIFGTAASFILRTRIYDTQCGAKLFRAGPALEAALAEPFGSRWFFDVELLGRLLIGAPGVAPVPPWKLREVPLRRWRDVGGSKLRSRDFARVPLELLKIERLLSRRRALYAQGPAPQVRPSADAPRARKTP